MKLKYIAPLIFFFISLHSLAQDMQQGYTYLETGKYDKALAFFKEILKTYPNNKTANLCYGRAVGLNGNPTKAVLLFENLLKKFPNDFEIKINYAESLLWDNNYTFAKKYYEQLLREAPKNFTVLLGYANTLSNLKKYKEALIYINKALIISPKNNNALLSKKYIHLGYANFLKNNHKYTIAENYLKKNLHFFPNDKETLLNLAELYLISKQLKKAEETYLAIGNNPQNYLISLNGLSLTNHLNFKEKESLKISEKAIKNIHITTDAKTINQTKERYIQALIWNQKYSLAEKEINKLLATKETPENWMLSLRATLNIYKSNFKKSLTDYNTILKKDTASFDGNLGKANTLKALGYYKKAYNSAYRTLQIYNNQKDALNFINNLNKTFTPFTETKVLYSFDNGNNNAYSFLTNVEFPVNTKLKFSANYTYRTTNNSDTEDEATSNNLLLGASYQLKNNITLNGSIGITSSTTKVNSYKQLLTDVSLHIKPFKLQNLSFAYKREVQNFNAALIAREIVQNNFVVNYNLNTNFNLGWFTQYYYTSQNDNNKRDLLFTSLYYNVLKRPSLKIGLNYQYISFKNQVPILYFSPEEFNASELFLNIIKNENDTKTHKWFYELTAAVGYQFIENNEKQSTYRLQGKIGYKLNRRSFLNVFGNQSNIASTTAAGFVFSEIGIRFKWYLFKKPLFNSQLF
ncbi:tetratricopeptide repeat protein [Tenacibaculum mesophilum]|uniref:tetratricopeptide repeat protein n=1 Tax=Tenacibaculum mesophilum TaxID=104268 RepID=UPI002491569E|nr:tetratricopeptide repeat protein [Tenacibaculum mesophilum]